MLSTYFCELIYRSLAQRWADDLLTSIQGHSVNAVKIVALPVIPLIDSAGKLMWIWRDCWLKKDQRDAFFVQAEESNRNLAFFVFEELLAIKNAFSVFIGCVPQT